MAEHCSAAGAPAEWTDAELVAAMRREEPAALAELHARFHPLLARLAQRWGVPLGERGTVATDVLTDVALALLEPTACVPRSLAAYLATSLRRRLAMEYRARTRRARRHAAAADPAPLSTPAAAAAARAAVREGALAEAYVVRSTHSEHALRASAGPAGEAALALDPALAALAEHLDQELGDAERLLLVWLGHGVPLGTIAGWLGVRYDAAVEHATSLPAAERRALHRFFRRAGLASLWRDADADERDDTADPSSPTEEILP